MKTHLINLDSFGVFEDDYEKFFAKRCNLFSNELKKRIIPQDIDAKEPAATADQTAELELE
jgi:hypothetical protein